MLSNPKILKKYAPMTETAFYILLCCRRENHGAGIAKDVARLTGGEVQIGAGTMYGSLGKFENDGLIVHTEQIEKRKFYVLTPLGKELLKEEMLRIERIYGNIREVFQDGGEDGTQNF